VNHHPNDNCKRQRCLECSKKFRHEHDCGVNVCPGCKSIDMLRRRYDYECLNCGLLSQKPLRMEIKARLAMGA
jgi:hypothetical protein